MPSVTTVNDLISFLCQEYDFLWIFYETPSDFRIILFDFHQINSFNNAGWLILSRKY